MLRTCSTPFGFDVSVWESVGRVAARGARAGAGARLRYHAPRGTCLGLLVRERVTVLRQTPSAFYQLMQADARSRQLSVQLALRAVVCGGEALDPARLQRVVRAALPMTLRC